jgi:hypothetical protein
MISFLILDGASKVKFFPKVNVFEHTTSEIAGKCLFLDVWPILEKGHMFWRFSLSYPERAHF